MSDEELIRIGLLALKGILPNGQPREGYPGEQDDLPPVQKGVDEAFLASQKPGGPARETYAFDPPGLMVKRMDTVKIEPVRWLVPGHVPAGMMTILAGDGGSGKSTLSQHLAACVTRGEPAFGLDYPAPPAGEVLLATCEEALAQTVAPRLAGFGASLAMIHHVEGVKDTRKGGIIPFSIAHASSIEQQLRANRNIKLLIIDPITAFVGRAKTDDHKDSELRAALAPLVQAVEPMGVAIVIILHFNKAPTVRAVQRILGSVGYVNLARAVYVVLEDREEPGRRLLLPAKWNLGVQPKGRAFGIGSLSADVADQVIEERGQHLNTADRQALSRQLCEVSWQGNVDVSADEALAAMSKSGNATKVEKCAEWIKDYLAVGPAKREQLDRDGERECFTVDNIKEAITKLKADGLKSRPFGKAGTWWIGFGDTKTWEVLT